MKTYLKKTGYVILSAQFWQQVERFVRKPTKTRPLDRHNYTHLLFLIISKEISWHGKLINSAQQIIRPLGSPSLLFKSSLPDPQFDSVNLKKAGMVHVVMSFAIVFALLFFLFLFCSEYILAD